MSYKNRQKRKEHLKEKYQQEKQMHRHLASHLSRQAITRIRAVPHHCYENAWRTMLAFPQWLRNGAFIEGWFVIEDEDEIVLNEHGWCELASGSIVDPSVLLLVDDATSVSYFPGVHRSWSEVRSLVKALENFPYVRYGGNYGSDGLAHPRYKRAYDAAMKKVEALAAASPSKRTTLLRAEDPSDYVLEAIRTYFL